MAGRLTPGWRKPGNSPVAAPPRPAPAAGVDHTEALERWASSAVDRPRWMADSEPLSAVSDSTAVSESPTPTASPAPPDEPSAPEFDDATDRFALFAMRAAEARSLFAPGDALAPVVAGPVVPDTSGQAPATDASIPAQSGSGWRPDDVHVSSADIDADALRLEMLAARAAELRESRGDFAMPAGRQPFTGAVAADVPANAEEADERVAFWRKDAAAVSAEEFDADAARLEMLASRAAENRHFAPEPLSGPAAAAAANDERVAFWRQDAAVVTAAEFDADAARLESLAARGPIPTGYAAAPALESTPFWEQQERLRAAAEQRAAAEAAARDAAANDEWHSRWERVAEEAARRGATPDPLGGP
ncbi:MAG: hypothetical protein QOF57_1885 [Frankiaceae bacterium]|jgi:hypothetical protein|nr:hypothetical protein [Frankiaceae bacterium]